MSSIFRVSPGFMRQRRAQPAFVSAQVEARAADIAIGIGAARLVLSTPSRPMRGRGNRGAAGSYLKQNYEMLAERARGLLSGEVSRPDEHETRRHTI